MMRDNENIVIENASLKNRVAELEAENNRLKRLLKESGIEDISNAKVEIDAAETITPELARKFFSYFWGRTDVYSRRVQNKNTGKTGYFPQCDNFWRFGICPKARRIKKACKDCEHRAWTKLQAHQIIGHLRGSKPDCSDVIGIYPLFPDNTCRFIVFDFDNHESDINLLSTDEVQTWQEEVSALCEICRQNDIPVLTERSRSGKGAHVWIFFETPIEAVLARNFAFALLAKGAESVNLKNFRYYDRLLPAQDSLPEGGLGNLIALPLQGVALQKGNSAFVDDNWNAYSDQWKVLFSTQKLSKDRLLKYIGKWTVDNEPLNKSAVNETKPWERSTQFQSQDVIGQLSITLSNAVYINSSNIKPRLQNQIRRLAAFANPVYFKNGAMGLSNFANPRYIYLGEDDGGYISIPRGLLEVLLEKCKTAEISCQIDDVREEGRKIAVMFNGNLHANQETAVSKIARYDFGILNAATAFGKTVVCSKLIAEKKVNTLILLESSVLIEQWEKSLSKFLIINEELPEYFTKTGQKRKREHLVGKIYGPHDSSTGIIDIAMAGSLYKKGELHNRLNDYGMVIVDECHHAASETVSRILKAVKAKYVYGVSATPFREDGLEKINYMLLGPVRYQYSAKEKAAEQNINRIVIPRFTRVIYPHGKDNIPIYEAYKSVCGNTVRNSQIVEDVRLCIAQGRTPIVLTKFKEHATVLYEELHTIAKNVFLLTGNDSSRRRRELRKNMEQVPQEESMLIVATGQLAGEGFDCPRLDTLIMAAPVAWKGLVEQYAGRLNRDYPGKTDIVIYDYVDAAIPVFERMYAKRLKTYKQIGYSLSTNAENAKQQVNSIFEADSYMPVYVRDLQEAKQEIVISSSILGRAKISETVKILKEQQEKGIKITIVTRHLETYAPKWREYRVKLLKLLHNNGFHVETSNGSCKQCAVIDNEIVWYGSVNLLSEAKQEDNIMRAVSKEIAAELLEIIFSKENTAEYLP